MSSLQTVATTFILLTLSVGAVLIISFIFDTETFFPTPHFQQPPPVLQQSLFPSNLYLLNLPHFKYIINNDVCNISGSSEVYAILLVTSHAGDIEARSALRRAYPDEHLKQLGIHRIFLLAVSDPKRDVRYNQVPENALQDENQRFADIVQGDFLEAYRNLTYKHMMGLQWVTRYCSQAQYVIKMDDDIIVNFYRLVNLLHALIVTDRKLMMGYLLKDTRPVREPENKWYVSLQEYSSTFYPPFLSGWLYVTTPLVAKLLVDASDKIPYFWIDDTFVTGLLAFNIGLHHTDISKHFTLHSEFLQCCVRDSQHECDYIVGPSDGDTRLVLRFQEHAAKCYISKCPPRLANRALNKTCVAPRRKSMLKHGHGEIKPVRLF